MRRRRSLTPAVRALALLIALAPVIAACGKSGPPRAPEGEESVYFFPRFQPAQDTDPPLFRRAPATAAPAPGAEAEAEGEARRPSRFMRRPDFNPFTDGFDSSGTFETAPK